MTYQELIKHFRTLTKAAQCLGLERQVVHAWGKRGQIPIHWQLKIAAKTGLRPDEEARREAKALAPYFK